MNKKILAVISREYVTRVRTKGFIIGTMLFPLILVFVFAGIFIFAKFFQPSTRHYFVVDQTGRIFSEFVRMLPDTLKNGQPKYTFTQKIVPDDELETAMSDYQDLVRQKKIHGYLVIPHDIVDSRQVKYSARSVSDFDEQRDLRNALSRIVVNYRLENMGLSAEKVRQEMSLGRVKLVSSQVTETGEIKKSGVSSFALTYILTYILLLMIMIYGQTMMRSVIEEKSQRITETIVASLKPVELMVGKIIGICALGLTQLTIISVFIYFAVQYGEPLFVKFGVTAPAFLEMIRQIHFSPVVFAFLILFFLMGFVFFSTLFAAVGAIVSTDDEGQQYQMPLIFLVIIGYFIMFTVIKNPDTTMAFWVSLVPFFTPMVMFARIAVSDPILPSGAILSPFTMMISIVIMIWFVAKIYRVGILMYGKKPSVKEAVKWLRYK
ncbi:MAG: ABC transporter permease [bacterium]